MADEDPVRKSKGGRPRLPAGQVRTSTIGVRVSAAEYEALRCQAEFLGLTPAQWLRTAALERRLPRPPVPAVNFERYAELGRLAGNLNQLARAANEGRPVRVDRGLIERLIQECTELRKALLGVAE